ncbi:hypothetical protein GCM10007304_17710 [Rhodococcoides trifolii]|uniref:Uncharacterized protein n=1 Tax=Rhodococcoides trifolii TaxID=908250 RepID=A0A917D0K7_9NOCA|nr:hypothetical protein [Rhodococcus trifolii]GGG04028.1 hypothetical protein GCM10007304_17710 [Rhodococcus trifolii]
MSEFLGSLAIGEVGAGTLVVIAVLMLYFGKLVTKAQHDRELADRDKQIAAHIEAGAAKDATIAEQATQITKLVESVSTSTHAIEAMQQLAVTRRDS